MIDTVVANLEKARASLLPGSLGLKKNGFVYVTLHRPSNVDNQTGLATIMAELKLLAGQLPVVFPCIHVRARCAVSLGFLLMATRA